VAVAVHSRTAGVGTTAPDFELAEVDGTKHRLSSMVADGPVVVVFLRGFG
jgi:peroxiredoxin